MTATGQTLATLPTNFDLPESETQELTYGAPPTVKKVARLTASGGALEILSEGRGTMVKVAIPVRVCDRVSTVHE